MSSGTETRVVGSISRRSTVLGLGCWSFGGSQWGGQDDEDSHSAMAAALEEGVTHFDTAQGYGGGRSERVVGAFLTGCREKVFLATKMFPPRSEIFTPQQALDGVETSLEHLQTDHIDLFYIHWPRTGRDLRPLMQGLEQARSQGKIGGIGVSNFSVEQMTQVLEVGVIDAHQLCYNLFWRFPEKDIMPFCREHNIGLITYSSIAQGILTGKFGPEVAFPPDDQRAGTVLFDPAVYPHLHAATEAMKPIAQNAGRPLVELAIRWCAAQHGVSSVLVGARDAGQMHANARSMGGEVEAGALAALTQISDGVRASIPDAGNIFRFYP